MGTRGRDDCVSILAKLDAILISFNFNLTSFFFVLNFVKTIIFVTSACLELNFDNVHCFFNKNL